MVIVCNPNNPTGDLRAARRAARLPARGCRSDVVVVLDEAYIEYVTDPRHEDSVAWLDEFPNLIILRTFSKIYGLAGLRVGYGITHRPLVEADRQDPPAVQPQRARPGGRDDGARATRSGWPPAAPTSPARGPASRVALDSLGIEHVPSQANFLFLRVEGLPVPGKEVPQALLERGVMTRSGYAMGCPGWLRLTIGSTDENDLFLRLLTEIAGERTEA